ncbi:MAG: helix-turn-helix transcriptional regulator [Candidatus Omnitrophota bacterium]
MVKVSFGQYIKRLRLKKGYGLRSFAKEIGWLPSNLSHLETGRINPPREKEVLLKIAKKLELKKNSKEWNNFLDLAANTPDRVPVDIADFINDQELAPVMLRTVANKKLSKAQIKKLIEDIKKM